MVTSVASVVATVSVVASLLMKNSTISCYLHRCTLLCSPIQHHLLEGSEAAVAAGVVAATVVAVVVVDVAAKVGKIGESEHSIFIETYICNTDNQS